MRPYREMCAQGGAALRHGADACAGPVLPAGCVGAGAPIPLFVTVRTLRNLGSARARPRAALVAIACALAVGHAHAEPETGSAAVAAGADELAAAREAWQHRKYAAAELHYKSALDHGGLAAADTLDAYIHLGAARAVRGRKDLARAAFRQAALIDVHFKPPHEAGRRAAIIAAQAKREEAKLGSIVLNAAIPQSVPGGESFGIDATLDPKHAAVTAKVGIEAVEAVSGKRWATSDVAATKTHFEVPASVSAPGTMLLIRVDALDPHDNRLASREQRVQVKALPAPPPNLDLPPPKPPPPNAPSITLNLDTSPTPKEKAKSGGGFWSSPWPYLVGGVVLAAGGAFAYYELRPTDDVSLGGARITTR